MKSICFKEWSLVCEALERGEQSIILRKGGIAEGRAGFSFQHREFFLFPTFFHEQIGNVRNGATTKCNASSDRIVISLYAEVERVADINSLESAEALAPLHVLKPEVVRERFQNGPGLLKAALVRVFRLEQPWIIPNETRFGGCRSWVDLPEAPELAMKVAINDGEFENRRAEFDVITSSGAQARGQRNLL